jgi:hypothetical protein
VLRSTSQPFIALPSQLPRPALHVNPQADAEHVALAPAGTGQARPHIPQFVRLVRVSTSQPSDALPLQSAKPGRHENPQTPVLHVAVALAGAVHARPHIPQFATAVPRFVSQPFAGLPSQSPEPMLQRNEQTAALHVGVAFMRAGHAMPQPPQCAAFVRTFASQPLPAMRSQSSNPASHTNPQRDIAQVGVEAATSGHAVLHAPQCAGDVAVLTQLPPQFERDPQPLTQPMRTSHTGVVPPHAAPQRAQLVVVFSGSQPLPSSASQFAVSGTHVCTHAPVEQLAVVLVSATHACPHRPQFSLELRRTSHPSAGSALQSPQPASHSPIVQRPAVHAAVACANVQRKPHAPQLFGSFAVTVHASPHTTPASHAGGGGPASASASIATMPSGAAASGRTPA